MSDKCREAFEKAFPHPDCFIYDRLCGRFVIDETKVMRPTREQDQIADVLTARFDGYQAGRADLERENAELKSHIERLRTTYKAAFGDYGLWYGASSDASHHRLFEDLQKMDDLFGTAPAQSLAAHDKEVREKCAKVCDARSKNSAREGLWALGIEAGECAAEIRAMED